MHYIWQVKQSQKNAAQPLQVGVAGDSSNCLTGNTWSLVGGYTGTTPNPTFAGCSGVPSANGAPTSATNAPSLHEDTIGAHMKSGIAQYVALELSRNSNVKDEDVFQVLSPGLIVDDSLPEITESAKRAGGKPATQQQHPSCSGAVGSGGGLPKSSGSLSAAGSFRSVGQSSAGGSFSGSRPFGRGSTSFATTDKEGELGRPVSDLGSMFATPKVPSSTTAGSGGHGSGHVSLAVPNLLSRSPSIASVLATSGGVGQQSIMSIGHFALVSTLSHTTRLDAPILQYLPWLKSVPSVMQQGYVVSLKRFNFHLVSTQYNHKLVPGKAFLKKALLSPFIH